MINFYNLYIVFYFIIVFSIMIIIQIFFYFVNSSNNIIEVIITNIMFNFLIIIVISIIFFITTINSNQNRLTIWFRILANYLTLIYTHFNTIITTINSNQNRLTIWIRILGKNLSVIWNNTKLELYKYRLNHSCYILYYIIFINLLIYYVVIQRLLLINNISYQFLLVLISKIFNLFYICITIILIILSFYNIIHFYSSIIIILSIFTYEYIYNHYYLFYYHNFNMLSVSSVFTNINIKLSNNNSINKIYNRNRIIYTGSITSVYHIKDNFVSFKVKIYNYNNEYTLSGFINYPDIKHIHTGTLFVFININNKISISLSDIKFIDFEEFHYLYNFNHDLLDSNLLIHYQDNNISNNINKTNKIIKKNIVYKNINIRDFYILPISNQNID